MTQTTTTISRDIALDTVNRYLQAIAGATSTDEITALYADGATVEDPVGSDPAHGKEAIAAFFSPMIATVRRETELLGFRHSGDSAAFHFRVRTHTPDSVIEIEPIDVMTFTADGLITSVRAFWSPEDVRQL
jgi:steroid Delta-isomerase